MKYLIYFLIGIIAISSITSSNLHKINIQRKESREKSFEREFFISEFQKYSTFNEFINSNKDKSNFLSKHTQTLKNYWRSYIIRSQKIENILKALSTEAGNAIEPLTNVWASEGLYTAEIFIGTPPQKFNIDIDTGSADLWVASTLCTNCVQINKFNVANSSTFTSTRNGFAIQYEDNSLASGIGGVDTVSIAGLAAQNFVVNVIYYELGQSNSSDGTMGFGPQNQSNGCPNKSPTFVQTLKSQGKIENAVFSFYFGAINNPNPQLVIGGADSSQYTGTIKYYHANINLGGGWLISFGGITVNGKTFAPKNSNNNAVIDTGTTTIAAPQLMIDNVLQEIGGFNLCGLNISTLPSIYFNFSGDAYEFTPQDYVVADTIDPQCRVLSRVNNLNFPTFSVSILGDSFIQVYYSVFDFDNSRIGFAKAIQN